MLFLEPDSAKGVTHLTVGVGDAECNRTGTKVLLEISEELGAGEIDVGTVPSANTTSRIGSVRPFSISTTRSRTNSTLK